MRSNTGGLRWTPSRLRALCARVRALAARFPRWPGMTYRVVLLVVVAGPEFMGVPRQISPPATFMVNFDQFHGTVVPRLRNQGGGGSEELHVAEGATLGLPLCYWYRKPPFFTRGRGQTAVAPAWGVMASFQAQRARTPLVRNTPWPARRDGYTAVAARSRGRLFPAGNRRLMWGRRIGGVWLRASAPRRTSFVGGV